MLRLPPVVHQKQLFWAERDADQHLVVHRSESTTPLSLKASPLTVATPKQSWEWSKPWRGGLKVDKPIRPKMHECVVQRNRSIPNWVDQINWNYKSGSDSTSLLGQYIHWSMPTLIGTVQSDKLGTTVSSTFVKKFLVFKCILWENGRNSHQKRFFPQIPRNKTKWPTNPHERITQL